MDYHKTAAVSPYNKLFIYYFDGKLTSKYEQFGQNFLGNWEEGDTTFLFFSAAADDKIDRLLFAQPDLILKDRFCMSYDEWHGEPVNPFKVGRFSVMPPWKIVKTDTDDVPIILDPGVVFGAGSHPTTRDCLEAIEIIYGKHNVVSSVDLGTGTGLLSIAAAKLGSRNNYAVDNNFLAAKTARKNISFNNLDEKINVACGSAEDFLEYPAELMIANIHYDVMKKLVVQKGFLNKKWFILSGLLRSEARKIEMQLSQCPVIIIKKWIKDGVWHTFLGKSD